MAGANPSAFQCPKCGANIKITAVGQSLIYACGACGAHIDLTKEKFGEFVIAKGSDREPLIPLGTRGKFRGVLWEVIGFLVRSDGPGEYYWEEYLLYNPMHGFRWLTCFGGHWNYVMTMKEKPVVYADGNTGGAHVYGKDYMLFHKGTAVVKHVLGEFYWRVQLNEKVSVADYVAPPEMLSLEKSPSEKMWSLGVYAEPEEIQSAFGVKESFPRRTGIAPNQPLSLSNDLYSVYKKWAVFVACLIIVHVWRVNTAKNEVVYSQSLNYDKNAVEKIAVLPEFEIKDKYTNLELDVFAPVSNYWLEVQWDLVNEESDDNVEYSQGVEYYYGVDGGESWSEGSQRNSLSIPSIGAGKYHFNVEPTADPYGPILIPYQVTVRQDVVYHSNFWLCLLLLTVYPGFRYWRSRSFEVQRWSTSDFSPYWEHKEEDDDE